MARSELARRCCPGASRSLPRGRTAPMTTSAAGGSGTQPRCAAGLAASGAAGQTRLQTPLQTVRAVTIAVRARAAATGSGCRAAAVRPSGALRGSLARPTQPAKAGSAGDGAAGLRNMPPAARTATGRAAAATHAGRSTFSGPICASSSSRRVRTAPTTATASAATAIGTAPARGGACPKRTPGHRAGAGATTFRGTGSTTIARLSRTRSIGSPTADSFARPRSCQACRPTAATRRCLSR